MKNKEKIDVVYGEILNLYTRKKDYNEWMHEPFSINEFAYSTNSYIICKLRKEKINFQIKNVPQNKENSVIGLYEIERKLKIKINVSDIKQKSNTVPIVDEYEDNYLNEICNECNGNGYVEWQHNEYYENYDCPVCGGDGKMVGKKLVKTGKKIKDSTFCIDILGSKFKISDIDLIIKTADMLRVDNITILGQTKYFTLIKISDIEVVVMSMDKKNKNHIQNN